MKPARAWRAGTLAVEMYPSRASLGRAAGAQAAQHLREAIAARGAARMIFACAPSQDEFLAALVAEQGVDWSRITAFHMDEYVGLPATHPASFRAYLRRHVLSKVTVRECHELAGDAPDPAAEARRYGLLLAAAPVDLACLGIGENCHLAFNDPPVADFADPLAVKRVALDEACRRQQVNDGCFPAIDAVPRAALTLTIPTLLAARHLTVVVPGVRKAAAVAATLGGPIATACPASILRTHRSAVLFVDPDSIGGVKG